MPNIAQDTWRLITRAAALAMAGRGRRAPGDVSGAAHETVGCPDSRNCWGEWVLRGLRDWVRSGRDREPAEPPGRRGRVSRTRRVSGTRSRRSGKSPERAGRPSWLPGDLRQTDLVTKVHGALAAHHLRRARPGASRIEQARDPSPNMPVRELGGIRPPVRGLLFNALRRGVGFALHRSPLGDMGIGERSAADAADPQFNDILPAGQAGVNGQIAPRW